jgi:molybdopterin-guanine dinucleotide biosynthesis protein A
MTMARYDKVEGFILAGGESSRMGRAKGWLEMGGVPVIVRTARLVEPMVARVTLVGGEDRAASRALRFIPDERAGRGPLGGILSALRNSTGEWNLVLGCDLPYLTAEWLEYLIQRALGSQADVVLPHSAGGAEPLCALYRTRCVDVLATALERGVRKVTDGLAGLAVEDVPPSEWKAFDSTGRLLKNMNTPEDYEEARAFFAGKER